MLALSVHVSMWIAARFAAMRSAGVARAAPPTPGLGQAVVIGMFMWIGYLLVLWALSLAPLSVVAPVRETAVVGVAVWGVWRLHETRGAAMKLSGALATLVGVALLAF
jgi:drug/metabolite transporter (DMT)-like permease